MSAADSAVYFGYKTALELARSIDDARLPRTRGSANQPPNRSPGKNDIARALERLAIAYPSARLSLPAHVLTASPARCRPAKTHASHLFSQQVSANSFCRMEGNLFFSIPPLACIQESTRLANNADRLELAFELCGSYMTHRTAIQSSYQAQPLTTTQELKSYATYNSSLRGAHRLAGLLSYVADESASPRETKLALVVGLRKMHGGGGAGLPRMNFEVRTNREARGISGKSHLRCDLCWPEAKLDVEYQSREHHQGERSRISDSRRANALVAMGWTVVCVTNDELDSLSAMNTIIDSIRRKLNMKPSRNPPDYRARQIKLRRQLGLPIEPFGLL